jgi:hypothetical protein
METVIVIIIVAAAAAFLGRHYCRKYKKADPCGCGCTACPADKSTCDVPEANGRK